MKYYNPQLTQYVDEPLEVKGLVAIDEEAILSSIPAITDCMDVDVKFDQYLFQMLYMLPATVIIAIKNSLRISGESYLDLLGKRFMLSNHLFFNDAKIPLGVDVHINGTEALIIDHTKTYLNIQQLIKAKPSNHHSFYITASEKIYRLGDYDTDTHVKYYDLQLLTSYDYDQLLALLITNINASEKRYSIDRGSEYYINFSVAQTRSNINV